MLIITGVQLYEHGVWAGGEMAFYYFGYFFEFGHNVVVHRAALEVDAYISTCGITHNLLIDMVARTGDDV